MCCSHTDRRPTDSSTRRRSTLCLSTARRDLAPEDAALLAGILTSYGQPPDVSARVLRHVGVAVGFPLYVVVHGHDRQRNGFFTACPNQCCPVIFGAERHNKRYLDLDLAGRYESAHGLRDGIEIKRLYA